MSNKRLLASVSCQRTLRTLANTILALSNSTSRINRLVVSEGTAATDGENIYYSPDCAESLTSKPAEQFTIVRGLIVHECAHLVFTDFMQHRVFSIESYVVWKPKALTRLSFYKEDWFQAFLGTTQDIEIRKKLNILNKNLFNMIEDGYVEHNLEQLHILENYRFIKDLKFMNAIIEQSLPSLDDLYQDYQEGKIHQWDFISDILFRYASFSDMNVSGKIMKTEEYQSAQEAFDLIDCFFEQPKTELRLCYSLAILAKFGSIVLDYASNITLEENDEGKLRDTSKISNDANRREPAPRKKTKPSSNSSSGADDNDSGSGNGSSSSTSDSASDNGNDSSSSAGDSASDSRNDSSSGADDNDSGSDKDSSSRVDNNASDNGNDSSSDASDDASDSGKDSSSRAGANVSDIGNDSSPRDEENEQENLLQHLLVNDQKEDAELDKISFGNNSTDIHAGINIIEKDMQHVPLSAYQSAEYANIEVRLNKLVAATTRAVTQRLKSEEMETKSGFFWGPTINSSELWRRDQRIFSKKSPGEEKELAIGILIDESSSMEGSKIRIAKLMSMIMHEVAHKLSIPCCIYGHKSGSSSTTIPVYSAFDNRVPASQIMHSNADGNTRCGLALKFVLDKMKVREETKKMVFYVNDGQPCARNYKDDPAKADIQNIAKQYRIAGIQLIVCGIDDQRALQEIYGKAFMNIKNLNSLPKLIASKVIEQL